MFKQLLYIKLLITTANIICSSIYSANAQSTINLTSKQLDSVFIKGYVKDKDRSSFQTSRLNIYDYENPQVTTSVGPKLINNRNYFTQSAMLSNATGVTPSWAGLTPNFTIRGFRTRSNFRNGLNAYLQYSDENSNIQQLDVVKGPSGTLFGGTNIVFGGLINTITYVPLDSTFTKLSLSTGNNNLHRANIDINKVLDSCHKALFRIFGTYANRKSFQDQGLNRNIFVSPSLSYQLSPKLKIKIEAEILNKSATNSPLFTPSNPLVNENLINVQNSKNLNLDYKKSYTDNSLLWKTTSVNFYTSINYLIAENWQSETNFASTHSSSNGAYQTNLLLNNNTAVARKVLKYDLEETNNQQIQQNFKGKFSVNGWENKLLIGLDFHRYTYAANYRNPGYIDTISVNPPSSSVNIFNADIIAKAILSKQPNNTASSQSNYSTYFSDVIKPIEALSIMISARYDRLVNDGIRDISTATTTGSYKQTSITPKVGATYQILPKSLTFFANYMSGFQNTAPSSINGILYNFKPQYGTQFETGIKTSIPNNLLDVTVSYYNINIRNTVMADPNDATKYIQDGKQYSRGVELDIQAQPIQNLFIHAGGAYNDSKITAAEKATKDLRPINSGPKWSGTWYINYELPLDKEKKWIIGFGGNYVGRDLIINSSTAGSFSTNHYTLFNSTIGYRYKQFSCNFTSENLFNEHYYYGGRGFITQGNLRQCILSMNINF